MFASVSDFLSCLISSVLNLAKLMRHAPASGKNRSSAYQNPNYDSCYKNLGQFFDKLKKEEKCQKEVELCFPVEEASQTVPVQILGSL